MPFKHGKKLKYVIRNGLSYFKIHIEMNCHFDPIGNLVDLFRKVSIHRDPRIVTSFTAALTRKGRNQRS